MIDSCKPPLATYLRQRRHLERNVELTLVKILREHGVDLGSDADFRVMECFWGMRSALIDVVIVWFGLFEFP